MLGVWLDPKLKWSAHAKIAQQKGMIAAAALKRIAKSTWGASFIRARLLYNTVVRPTITYRVTAWLEPEAKSTGIVIKKTSQVQAGCIRAVAGAFRATPINELETETFTPPLDIYCKEAAASSVRRTYASPVGDFIKEQYRMISSRLRRKGAPRVVPQIVPAIQKKLDWAQERERTLGATGREAVLKEWQERWRAQRRQSRWCSRAAEEEPSADRLKLHAQLKKAESSVLVQARTGRIGLAHFLAKARVPGYDSPSCKSCESSSSETAEHLLLHCAGEAERRVWWRGTTLHDLVLTPSRTASTAKWLIQSRRIQQFQLASRLLYSTEGA